MTVSRTVSCGVHEVMRGGKLLLLLAEGDQLASKAAGLLLFVNADQFASKAATAGLLSLLLTEAVSVSSV